ncbi:hypothetical protein QYF36_022484 [Acer negundo]|nr:hypothetical protein QYF36_022484 [Acer negundo]
MVIRGYASSDMLREAVLVFLDTKRRGVRPNKLTFPFLVKACTKSFALKEGNRYMWSCWFGDAVGYFVKMIDFGFEPDETKMVVMISVCIKLENLSLGKWIHLQVIERGMVLNHQLGTTLVDMYTKGGAVGYARLVSAMILGLG